MEPLEQHFLRVLGDIFVSHFLAGPAPEAERRCTELRLSLAQRLGPGFDPRLLNLGATYIELAEIEAVFSRMIAAPVSREELAVVIDEMIEGRAAELRSTCQRNGWLTMDAGG